MEAVLKVKERDLVLDNLKGILIILTVFAHVLGNGYGGTNKIFSYIYA